ncbi:MAG: YbhB/YbcL family Raf kinase inhibitor-like protein [Nitrospinota bacterium]|nr:MAG: YbhB/YbcL family Raf kinase inhibitor-like protein [Nitrospinota bacterium]
MEQKSLFRLLSLSCLLLMLSLTALGPAGSRRVWGAAPATLALTSPAFKPGSPIPVRYTCDGEDLSPPLQWSNVPSGTKSFALVVDDPDAPMGTWDHWILYDIPATTTRLPAGIAATRRVPEVGTHGRNSWRRLGYGGPCPPGGTHRYFFKLYALDTVLQLKPGATKKKLLRAMQGHILAQGELMGTYQRRR